MASTRTNETISIKTSWDSDSEQGTIAVPQKKSYRSWLIEDVDTPRCTLPLAGLCFMTGFMDAISFSATFVWCGFQTGNFIQLAIALAKLVELAATNSPSSLAFSKTQQQSLCSLLAFMVCATIIGRLGDVVGTHRRYWLALGSFLSTLFTAIGAIVIWQSHSGDIASNRGTPAWTNLLTFVGIAFMSASVAIQGVQAKKLNTHLGSTIVFTIVWMDILTDRSLLNLRKSIARRDHKLLSACALFIGTFSSRAILFQIGSAGALGVACGLRLLITIAWLFMPAKAEQVTEQK